MLLRALGIRNKNMNSLFFDMLEEIGKNLFVFYPSNIGSNVYILCGKKIALIDSSIKENERDIIEALSSLKIEPHEVSYLLFTHAHADHIGCSHLFKNAKKYMHSADAEYVELQDAHYTLSSITSQEEFPNIDTKLEDGNVIKIDPFVLKVIHTPGHTRGSVCFYDERQKLLFSGDTLFMDSCGRTDLPGGDEEQLIDSLLKIKFLDFKLLLPGHGVIFKGNQVANIDAILKSLKAKYI